MMYFLNVRKKSIAIFCRLHVDSDGSLFKMVLTVISMYNIKELVAPLNGTIKILGASLTLIVTDWNHSDQNYIYA